MPCPGAQAVSHGVWAICPKFVPGSAVSPKQVHPLPPAFAFFAAATEAGGIRNMMAWCTSGLLGKNCAETMYESFLTFGFTREQW